MNNLRAAEAYRSSMDHAAGPNDTTDYAIIPSYDMDYSAMPNLTKDPKGYQNDSLGQAVDLSYSSKHEVLPEHQDIPRASGCSGQLCQILFPPGFREELKRLAGILPALTIAQMCLWYVQPIATIFAGHLGQIELDAVGLACSLINVFGFSILVGMVGACDTSFSQTFGGNNKTMMGIYLQRCLIIIMLMLLPCYAIHLNMEKLLILLGQDAEVARLVGRYLLLFMPGMFSMFVYMVLMRYMQCQNEVWADIWIGLTGHAIHAVLQYVLLYKAKWGIDGSALAQVVYYIVVLLLRLVFMIRSDRVRQHWTGWSRQCLLGWGPLAKLAFYGSIMVCAEWWSYEVCTILSGLLGTASLGAQSLVINLTLIVEGVPYGIGVGSLICVGQHVGAGRPLAAKMASRVGMTISFFTAIVWSVILIAIPRYLGMVFTSDRDILDIISDVLPVVGGYLFFDSITIVGRFIYRGVAKQKSGSVIVFVAYYLLAMPVGFPLMFLTSLRLQGMWIGFLLSMAVMGTVMFVQSTWFFDWNAICIEAQGRANVKPQVTVVEEVKGGHIPLLTGAEKDPGSRGCHGYGAIEKGAVPGGAADGASLDLEDVPRSLVIKRVLTILAFVAMFMLGLTVRLTTQGLTEVGQQLGGANISTTHV